MTELSINGLDLATLYSKILSTSKTDTENEDVSEAATKKGNPEDVSEAATKKGNPEDTLVEVKEESNTESSKNTDKNKNKSKVGDTKDPENSQEVEEQKETNVNILDKLQELFKSITDIDNIKDLIKGAVTIGATEIARQIDTREISEGQENYITSYISRALGWKELTIDEKSKDKNPQTIKAHSKDGAKVTVTVQYDSEGRPSSINIESIKEDIKGDKEIKKNQGIDITYDDDGNMYTKNQDPTYTAESEIKIRAVMELLGVDREKAIELLGDKIEKVDSETKIAPDGTEYAKLGDDDWIKIGGRISNEESSNKEE